LVTAEDRGRHNAYRRLVGRHSLRGHCSRYGAPFGRASPGPWSQELRGAVADKEGERLRGIVSTAFLYLREAGEGRRAGRIERPEREVAQVGRSVSGRRHTQKMCN